MTDLHIFFVFIFTTIEVRRTRSILLAYEYLTWGVFRNPVAQGIPQIKPESVGSRLRNHYFKTPRCFSFAAETEGQCYRDMKKASTELDN